MYTSPPVSKRDLRTERLQTDLVIVGGGLAGACAAITAARQGIQVVLIQDRPVLGGNASSEVRLWILGATSHMGNNNRWAREGGVIDEILVENVYRNPEGNPLILDTILLEKVVEESNITLLLNTAAFELTKADADTIESVRAFCSQNSTMYEVHAPLFCDASGDGVLGFMAGAAFRMGAESRDEFDERFAPSQEYGELLGHSLYFYTKDTGRPVQFMPPSYALEDITKIPRWKSFSAKEMGCQLWWIEYGGRLDTVHETEQIKWELWKVVYGVWNHIKNSGQFTEAENLTLEWVGQIPGKRESRRFEGEYMMIQQDVIEQRQHADAVSFGGWAIDLHPADGVFSELPGCTQWHSKGVYQIPYRSMYSRNIKNLFLSGRIISASHIAFGSTRVMATCAHNGQAVGVAAALCRKLDVSPADLVDKQNMRQLQRDLLRTGQHIPLIEVPDEEDITTEATVTSSSELKLDRLPPGNNLASLEQSRAMLIPIQQGQMPTVGFWMQSNDATQVKLELRKCSREASFTPDELLSDILVDVAGTGDDLQQVEIDFGTTIDKSGYYMVCLNNNPGVSIALSEDRITGVLSLCQRLDTKVSKSSIQTPPDDIGVESFPFWLPDRRPGGKNLAMRFDPPLSEFSPENLTCGPERPESSANAWIAAKDDSSPWIELNWSEPKSIGQVVLALDTDFDHAMESVLMGHPERRMPFCAAKIRLLDSKNNVLAEVSDNHQTRCVFNFDATKTNKLRIELNGVNDNVPVSAFRVRVFEKS